MQLLCSPIGNRNFLKKAKQNITTEWAPHNVCARGIAWFELPSPKSQLRLLHISSFSTQKLNYSVSAALKECLPSSFHFSVPSGPPLDVRCQGVSPNTVSIEWSEPRREERNGIIRGYSVRYYPTTLCYGKCTEHLKNVA